MALIKFQLLILITIAVTACSTARHANDSNWQSGLYGDHPLVGKIWSSATNEFIESSELLDKASNSRYLLLGEKHDNPDHHALQALVLDELVNRNRVSTVAFEMMNNDSQPRLDTIQEQSLPTLDALKTYLEWDVEGWDWNFYGPLLQSAYNAGLPIKAANIDNAMMRQVYGGELPTEISGLLDQVVMDKLNADIDESHCGMLPESQFPAMVRVQQSRDSAMAAALGLPNSNQVQILIAGNYHVRRDLGVPNYLLARQSMLAATDIMTISFSEVDPETEDPADYLQQFTDANAYDYIWFTPAVSNEDYCASLRQN